MTDTEETFVPHIGWLSHERGDDVGRYLREGWFEYLEQAFCLLYLRPGDTVVDCGAHVGLFSVLAYNAMEGEGRIIAIEPNPRTVEILEGNLKFASADVLEVIAAAASSCSGTLILHAGAGEKSAYSSVALDVDGGQDIEVSALALDDILSERSISTVAFLKIDVEGAEADVLAGCSSSIAAGRLPLGMVEFTEGNQQDVGRSTESLAQAWIAAGYSLYRFDPNALALTPAVIEGPIEYENLFAAMDAESINDRLRSAGADARRRAMDVIGRGRAAFDLLKRACDSDHFRDMFQKAEAKAKVEQLSLIEDGKKLLGERDHARHRMHLARTVLRQLEDSKVLRAAWALRINQRPERLDELLNDE